MQNDILTKEDRVEIQAIMDEYQRDLAEIGNREMRRTKNGKRLVAIAEVKRSLALLKIAQRSSGNSDTDTADIANRVIDTA